MSQPIACGRVRCANRGDCEPVRTPALAGSDNLPAYRSTPSRFRRADRKTFVPPENLRHTFARFRAFH